MFAFINGKIAEAGEGYLVLENNGIGYELTVSSYTLQKYAKVGAEAKLHTYLQVREDGLSLYGFSSKEEKNMFEKLISVSGVGCKAAIAVMSGISVSDLALCIATGDAKKLTSVKGVGKKTAERIILELKEKVNFDVSENRSLPGAEISLSGDFEDAVTALAALGIPKSEAGKAVERAIAGGAKGLEEIIAKSLKSLY